MKNNMKKCVSLLLALTLMLSGLSALADVDKREIVYVLADATGETQSIIVSEQLYNRDGADEIADVSTLTDIVNVSGSETFTQDGDALTWNAGGSAISYQGTGESDLPVKVTFTYMLEGEEIDPADLAGQSGHLDIAVTYEALDSADATVQGKQESMPIPFLMATIFPLDDDVFANVTVENGQVMDVGRMKAAVCVGLPGLSAALKLSDYDDVDITIPESATISADVTDFASSSAYTVAMNYVSIADEKTIDIDLDIDTMADDLADAIGQLLDGTQELFDGTVELKDGAGDLNDGAQELVDGAKELSDGTVTLKDGASDLNDGAQELVDGAKELHDGTVTLKDGASDLNDGAATLADGAATLASGASDLNDGAATLAAGTASLNTGAAQLKDGLDTLTANSDTLTAGGRQLFQAILDTANSTLAQSAASLEKAGITLETLTQDNYADVITGIQEAYIGVVTAQVEAQADATVQQKVNDAVLAQVTEQVTDAVREQVTEQVKQAIAAQAQQSQTTMDEETLTALINQMVDENMATDEVQATIAQTIDGQMASDQVKALAAQQVAQQKETDTYAQSVQDAVKANGYDSATYASLSELLTSLTSVETFCVGLEAYTAGVDQAAAGAKSLADGAAKLDTGAQTLAAGAASLNDGAGTLSDGASTLADGTQSLLDGAVTLSEGAQTLADGTVTLKEGTQKLYDGSVELADGAQELADGTVTLKDGTQELYDGTVELSDGAQELLDGLHEFDDEAIEKLIDLLNDDILPLKARLEALKDIIEANPSYAGLSDGMTGQTTYIIRTAGVD